MTAYFVTCAVTLHLLWDAQFTAGEAALLIVLYVVYLLVCIYTSRFASQMYTYSHSLRLMCVGMSAIL